MGQGGKQQTPGGDGGARVVESRRTTDEISLFLGRPPLCYLRRVDVPDLGEGMKRAWYLAAWSAELRTGPLATRVLGHPLVLFRDRDGRASALEDRCPHKNAELSLGRVQGGLLRCPYHGWSFDGTGACVVVPSAGAGEALPSRGARRFATHEADGSIWVHLADGAGVAAPSWPAGQGASFQLATQVRAPLVRVLENFVDCSHTGFVHAGLFRGEPHRVVRAEVEETPSGVRIQTFGESDPGSLLSRLLVPGGQAIEHVDLFLAPHTVQVVYRFGAREIVTVSVCTPQEAAATRIFTRVWVHTPPLSAAMALPLKALTWRILRQDKRVLESQARVLERFGGARFQSVTSDRPTDWVARSLARYQREAEPPEGPRRCEIVYRL
jgi:phenylpropionate dioxygenase-like ring-hydroxylating dioxygenase large terminal subunit